MLTLLVNELVHAHTSQFCKDEEPFLQVCIVEANDLFGLNEQHLNGDIF